MAVTPGSQVGSFEIRELIGTGGMGEVYRAHDARLGRDVAIKVIPASFAADADRLRRFEQEARAAAALTHPNILAVHDIGTHQSAPYIVSELLRGMTLRERIGGGPLPVRKAIDVGVQIARGLAAAHQKNIVHRDLKPENVFVTDEGLVKILDFGLAKLTEVESRPASDVSTRQVDTQPGSVMGTAGYMSPEQLRAQVVDARSDLFSFGALMYELLAGARAFRGESSMDVATAILKEDPPDLPTDRHVPPALARIVDRCLEKNPAARFQSAGDLAFALEALSAPSGTTEALPAAGVPARRTMPWIAAAAAGLAIGAAATYGAVKYFAPPAPRAEAISFPLTMPEGVALVGGGPTGSSPAPLAVSPDGRHVAFLGSGPNNVRMIWIRSRSAVTPRMILGTEGAVSPFWSPDSRYVAFYVPGPAGKLKKVDISGGLPVEVCDIRNMLGGSWSPLGVIIMGVNAPGAGIQRVAATGGTPTAATTALQGEGAHSRPFFLPDGRHFVFRVLQPGNPVRGWLYLASLDKPDRTQLVETESSNTSYSAGHLLYLRGSSLMAHPFDAERLALAGDPYPLVQGVQTFGGVPAGVFSASENGVLAYQPGSSTSGTELRWFTRSGTRQDRVGDVGYNTDVRASRDGTLVAYSRRGEVADGTSDIWIANTATGLSNRFTFDTSNELGAVFSPDGRQVGFNSNRKGRLDLYQRATDGTSPEVELLVDESDKSPADWSHDGRYLLYVRVPQGAGRAPAAPDALGPRQQLWVLPLQGDRKPFPLIPDVGLQTPGAFSPDGRFVVYASNDGTGNQVFVTPFPATGTKWQISSDGGSLPRWSRDGREIFFFRTGGGTVLKAARVDATGPSLKLLEVKTLFQVTIAAVRSAYAPAPDGQRFLINTPAGDQPAAAQPIVVIDWPAMRPQGK